MLPENMPDSPISKQFVIGICSSFNYLIKLIIVTTTKKKPEQTNSTHEIKNQQTFERH